MKKILTGIAASPGSTKGKVKIIAPDKDVSAFPDNAVLVTEMTDPSMVFAMAKSSAIVTNTGGITSHPAIVSRELGIPCVVNTKEATTVLKDGNQVEVDGDKGTVILI